MLFFFLVDVSFSDSAHCFLVVPIPGHIRWLHTCLHLPDTAPPHGGTLTCKLTTLTSNLIPSLCSGSFSMRTLHKSLKELCLGFSSISVISLTFDHGSWSVTTSLLGLVTANQHFLTNPHVPKLSSAFVFFQPFLFAIAMLKMTNFLFAGEWMVSDLLLLAL